MKVYWFLIPLFLITFILQSEAQDGAAIFKTNCTACHRATADRLVGPGLANVHTKRTQEWFTQFVQSSQALINSGDADAIAVFEEYNSLQMPDQNLSAAEVGAIWDYLIEESPAPGAVTEEVVEEAPFEPTADEIKRGELLFTGLSNFENGGPTCNSCHHVNKDGLMAGGSFAVELSDAFERLGGPGIGGILSGLPFPAMKDSYEKHPLTEEEIQDMTAFLSDVSEQRYSQNYTNYGNTLLIWGVIGAFLLMGVFPALWFKRKKGSVNAEIYDRQIRSIN